MNNTNTQKINYHKELLKIIKSFNGNKKNLILHSCCAPCSSYCLEFLNKYFNILILYYNPNINKEDEFLKRYNEEKRFIEEYFNLNNIELDFNFIKENINKNLNFPNLIFNNDNNTNIKLLNIGYCKEDFNSIGNLRKNQKEQGEACKLCYEIRLKKAYEIGKLLNFHYFTTTLTVSPHKNSQILNNIGLKIEKENNVSKVNLTENNKNINFLFSDFKKNNGFKRSIELSNKFNLYRQDYCGCIFSKLERLENNKEKNTL